MNRTKSLFGVLACALSVIVLLSSVQTSSARKQKVIGLQLYSVMNSMKADAKGTLEKLASYGYNSYELVQWGGDPNVFGLPADEFKTICDALGADILSTHSSIMEDPAKEAEIMARWRQLFEIQKACGGKYFVIPSYKVEYTEANIRQMCDYFNRVGKVAAEYGLKLGYHNHSGEFVKMKDSDKIMWEYLVENTDPQYVCFELDVFWCQRGGKNPVDYLKKYADRIELLHIKDVFVIGESGEIDFESIFKQFYKNGMNSYFVEVETPKSLREQKNPDGTPLTEAQIDQAKLDAVRASAEYLKKAKFVK